MNILGFEPHFSAGPGKIFSECSAPLCAVRTILSEADRRWVDLARFGPSRWELR